MINISNTADSPSHKIWVISDSRRVDLDLSDICKEPVSGPVSEYSISELARYLLNPQKIYLKEKVIGCRVHYRKPSPGFIRRSIERLKRKDKPEKNDPLIEEIISNCKIGTPAFKDEALNAHFMSIWELLMPYDPVRKRIAKLDRGKIEDVTAMCEEIGGHRYPLNLQGDIDAKLDFVVNSLSKKTRLAFNKAYLSNGLFEMRGFDLGTFDPEKNYRLIKYTQEGREKYIVLNSDYKFEFHVNDNMLINYLLIFEQAIKADPRLVEAISLCAKGAATPLKLFFAEKLEHGYSEKRLPGIYRKMFSKASINPEEKEEIVNILNSDQGVVFFNYLPGTEDTRQKIVTNITVMHNLKALEPIKTRLPEVYQEIDKRASQSEAGKLYLLDSIREQQNV